MWVALTTAGCPDDEPEKPSVAPAFTGVPAAPPGASGARVVERSSPPPFRSVYDPGNVMPKVVPPGGPGAPSPQDPTIEEPPELPPDPFDDDEIPDEPFEDEPPSPGAPTPPPQGIGL